jgi:hypothetical protein
MCGLSVGRPPEGLGLGVALGLALGRVLGIALGLELGAAIEAAGLDCPVAGSGSGQAVKRKPRAISMNVERDFTSLRISISPYAASAGIVGGLTAGAPSPVYVLGSVFVGSAQPAIIANRISIAI